MAAAITDNDAIFVFVRKIDGDYYSEVIVFSEQTQPTAGFLRSRVADHRRPKCG